MLLQGTVIAIDLSAMEVDGDGRLSLRGDAGRDWVVRVPTGFAPPSPQSRDLLMTLKPGDRVEVSATAGRDGTLVIDHGTDYIERMVP